MFSQTFIKTGGKKFKFFKTLNVFYTKIRCTGKKRRPIFITYLWSIYGVFMGYLTAKFKVQYIYCNIYIPTYTFTENDPKSGFFTPKPEFF